MTPFTLLLVHHAQALDPLQDAGRPLSPDGLETAARLAAAVASEGFVPELIWHSGKRRARQTAEALWLAGDHRAVLSAVRGLQPADPPAWMRDQLAHETRRIALVGHQPHLPRLLEALAPGAGPLPPHGCVGLVPDGAGWREAWRFSGAR